MSQEQLSGPSESVGPTCRPARTLCPIRYLHLTRMCGQPFPIRRQCPSFALRRGGSGIYRPTPQLSPHLVHQPLSHRYPPYTRVAACIFPPPPTTNTQQPLRCTAGRPVIRTIPAHKSWFTRTIPQVRFSRQMHCPSPAPRSPLLTRAFATFVPKDRSSRYQSAWER